MEYKTCPLCFKIFNPDTHKCPNGHIDLDHAQTFSVNELDDMLSSIEIYTAELKLELNILEDKMEIVKTMVGMIKILKENKR